MIHVNGKKCPKCRTSNRWIFYPELKFAEAYIEKRKMELVKFMQTGKI